MPSMNDAFAIPEELVLGARISERVPAADQKRQRAEVEEILRRLRKQPGVILADEVGMGKTFVALAVAYTVATQNPLGPVVVMVPANLVDKWVQDLHTFCELYLHDVAPRQKDRESQQTFKARNALRFGVARHSVEFLKLLDDPVRERCHLVFLTHGALSRGQTDKWIRLALIAECLRKHGRGRATRLIQVKEQIHRFLGELLRAIGEERAHGHEGELWRKLIHTDPAAWREIYNREIEEPDLHLADDPVPKSVARALQRVDLKLLADALTEMPVRAAGGKDRIKERVAEVRQQLRAVEEELWTLLLSQARWRSPLLVMDEAHHLKNPETSLARQLQSQKDDAGLRTGDGSMTRAFDRMLFLTATPFQLGHHELVHVLERFGDVRWDEGNLGTVEDFREELRKLGSNLDESQRTAIALKRCWARLRGDDCPGDVNAWWTELQQLPREGLPACHRAVLDAYAAAHVKRAVAEESLRMWIVRHNKPIRWSGTAIVRRERLVGAAVTGEAASGGLQIPAEQLLPFFLAARSATNPGQDLLGEALCSSYEAFRFTREKDDGDIETDEEGTVVVDPDLSRTTWYREEFDAALKDCTGAAHPKMHATVQRAADLWENGEKVLVFAFYRQTCRALRIHIGKELEKRSMLSAQRQVGAGSQQDLGALIKRVRGRFFGDSDSPGRRAINAALEAILLQQVVLPSYEGVTSEQRVLLLDVLRRFLRVQTTLSRCFPLALLDKITPDDAVQRMLDYVDASGLSWRDKFAGFVRFIVEQCSVDERTLYLEALKGIRTGGIRVEDDDGKESSADDGDTAIALANVQVATGTTKRDTRARLMRAFNTPFFPDILVCSEVMGEGVDLQRFCRHVIHHDLDWNPSSMEQRTGRIDRLSCKAEGRHSIVMHLPYLAGTADERQYRVMTDREQWFRVVMGQKEVSKLIARDSECELPLPKGISEGLSFRLDLGAK